ncbi:MAG: HypC/HybG/HupF family hydrogenase formation chaperone [Candidatus Bipolaricaulota bacterium]|nr:HypC/HybG/HupF family hydrogenase formation chaperone [Candidatus Bipolaricaulota bacterium]MBS3791198.1 HypC/HybG/HupF family hydrogenase formation chaperone [Candidatus Bipolaricaulota bacterium]
MCLAIPGEVLAVEDERATVDVGGVEQEVRLDTLSEDVAEGDYLLVHTGFAIQKLSPEEAQETLSLFDELIETNKQLEEEREV